MLGRLFLWKKALSLRGADITSQANLLISALTDLILYTLGRKQNPVSILGGVYYTQTPGGLAAFRVRPMTDDLYFIIPGREPAVEDALVKYAKVARSFLDVGANVGYYTVSMSLLGLEVVAIEPVPETASLLEENLELNGLKGVKVLKKAAWDEEGELLIHVRPGMYGEASLLEGRGEGLKVKTFKLDQLVHRLTPPILLKVDAEGAEVRVLRGGKDLLRDTVAVILEVLPQNLEGVRKELEGFRTYHLGGNYYLAVNESLEP